MEQKSNQLNEGAYFYTANMVSSTMEEFKETGFVEIAHYVWCNHK